MASVSYPNILEQLLTNELSKQSAKKAMIAGYERLVEILQVHGIQRYLHGYHEQLFQCISLIILRPCHSYFEDEQLRRLLELASYSRILTMSQNEIVNGWRRNIPERLFQGLDYQEKDIEEDDEDDNWSEVTTESEDEDTGTSISALNVEESEGDKCGKVSSKMKIVGEPFKRLPNRMNQHEEHRLINSASSRRQKDKIKYKEYYDDHHLDHHPESQIRQQAINFFDKMNHNIKSSSHSKQPDKKMDHDRNQKFSGYTEKYNGKHDCSQRLDKHFLNSIVDRTESSVPDRLAIGSTKKKNKKPLADPVPLNTPPKEKNLNSATREKEPKSALTGNSSNKANKANFSLEDDAKIQKVYNCVATLMGGNQTANVIKETFDNCYQLIKELEQTCAGQLSKVFHGKESSFYSLFCHIAQNDFLFKDQQYTKLYQLRKILLATKIGELKENSESFARSRPLISLAKIADLMKTASQLLLTIFNDLQEHVIRCPRPITADLYNVIKNLLKSTIVVDAACFDNFTNRILFDKKKEILSEIQLEELRSYLEIRRKRFDRSKLKQTWKQRLLLLNGDQLSCNMNLWIDELTRILQSDPGEPKIANEGVIDHSLWYFAVLIMASSSYLTGEQFKILLEQASQSPLFNPHQKFYLKHYLNNGQAPIMIEELKKIKAKLQSIDKEEKKSAYRDIVSILQREKPPYIPEKIETMSATTDEVVANDGDKKSYQDLIRIVDDHVMQSLINIVESIGWDKETFTQQDISELIELFINESTIVRPLSKSELKRLQDVNNEYLSLNELKEITLKISADLTELIMALKQRNIPKNDEFLDFLAITLKNIFQNHSKFSDEKCLELKSLIDKNLFGKKRYQSINQTYETARKTTRKSPVNESIVTATMLSTAFEQILKRDSKTFQEILNLIENLSKITRSNETTIDSEINRCLLSAIILEMTKFSEYEFEKEKQQLKKLVTSRVEFFSSILTQNQLRIVENCLVFVSNKNIDSLIQTLETDFSEQSFLDLVAFVERNFVESIHLNQLLRLILSSFDHLVLPVSSNLTLIKTIHDHPNFKNQSVKHQLQFLINLLQSNVHVSPKVIHQQLKARQIDDKICKQIITILTVSKNQNASKEWKMEMVQILQLLHHQDLYQHKIRMALEQSEMLKAAEFKQQLKCYDLKYSPKSIVKNKQNNASDMELDSDGIDSSAAHRQMFALLLSENQSDSLLVIDQIRAILTDQELPSNIRLNKFIQALEIIIKRPKQMPQILVSQWAELFRKNRGKIFKYDEQCDNLLMLAYLTDFNLPADTLIKLPEMLQSKDVAQRNYGLQLLMTLLKNTQIVHEKDVANHLPSKASQIYTILTAVIFNQMYSDKQVQQCLSVAKKSWLFNDQQRRKLQQTL